MLPVRQLKRHELASREQEGAGRLEFRVGFLVELRRDELGPIEVLERGRKVEEEFRSAEEDPGEGVELLR